MKTTLAHFPAASLLALACATIPASMARAQDNVIATMDVDGSNAFVDNVRQPPSGTDIRILDGNLVRTGADTSALVEIIPQGSVQLNENSAKLITESFFKGARCFAARLIAGELFINGENVCFLTNVGAVSGISHSRINIEVDERGTVLTVIEGMAELDRAPASMLVSASEQLVVLRNGEYYKHALDPAAAERTAEWTQDYFEPPRESGMSDGARTALGILGVIVAGKLIHEATDDDDDRGRGRDDDSSPPERQPPQDPARPPDDRRPPPGTRPPAGAVRRPSPVRQPQPDTCCVAGKAYRLTPAQCKARSGERGACQVVD